MEGTTEKDCSPLWNLYQQIVSDMKNTTPMWEEFISKASKLHSALKSALVAIAAFLDAFQKIADAATNARGATKEIGTALTRVCLRHRAIESRMKMFISTLMDTLITPLSERTDDWRKGSCATGALSRDHARECKRARTELRRKVADVQRQARKARRQPTDARRRADVSMQDVQERKQQLEEMEEKAVKAALIEERSRFCHFVSLLNPVVESEVAMLAEVGHLQEGSEQLIRHTTEPRTLPPASLQVICDIKSCYSGWAEASSAPHSPTASRLGSRKSSLTSISSLHSHCSDNLGVSGSTLSCSTPLSNASSIGTLPAPNNEQNCLSQSARLASVCSGDSGFRSQDALQRRSLYVDNGSDNQSVSSECMTPAKSAADDEHTDTEDCDIMNAASATWPDLKDTAQFERAASAIMGGRPHTISAGYERGHPRAALSVHTFETDSPPVSRPPLPTRCSSLERPAVPAKSSPNANTGQHEFKPSKPSSLPPHLTKDMPQALYVNMSELATLAASRAHQNQHNAEHPHQEKVCSESSASESSLESSSGYGSQGAFAAEDHALQQAQHADVALPLRMLVESEIVILRRDEIAVAREKLSISLGSLEAAVRSLDAAGDTPPFATISKKPALPKNRPLSMTATVWSRRGSSSSVGKPPPPVRRSSSISRPQRPQYSPANQSPQGQTDVDNLPPPPAFLLNPDESSQGHIGSNVAETVKQLTELKHTPASPGLSRRASQLQLAPSQGQLSTFQQCRSQWGSNASVNSAGNVNPIYGQTGHRIMAFENSLRKASLHTSNADIYREPSNVSLYGETKLSNSPHGSTPSTPSYGENNSFSSFGPRNDSPHYGQTGFKLQEKKYGQSNTIYAQPQMIHVPPRRDTLSPLALRKNIAARSHSADRHQIERSINGLAGIPSILMPTIMQWKGRKFSFIAACLIIITGWILSYSAKSATTLLISESCHGLGTNSILAVSLLSLSEMITPRYRNIAILSFSIVQALGITLVGIMAGYLHWKTISLIMCAPMILACVIACIWPESPSWLAYKGHLQKCQEAFTWLRGSDDKSAKELEELINSQMSKTSLKQAKQGLWIQITRRDFYVPSFHMFVLLNLMYWSGVMVILIYASQLIERATQSTVAAKYGSMVLNCIFFICISITGALIRRFNHKPVLLTSVFFTSICLISLCAVTYLQSIEFLRKDSLIFMYLLLAYFVCCSFGMNSIVFTVSAELMPVKHRGIGGALFVVYTCLLHTSSLKLSPYLFQYLDLSGTFLLYTVNAIVCGCIIWRYVPETKDRTLQEIENFYVFGEFERHTLDVNKAILNG